MPDAPTFVLVGHCTPDRFMLTSAITRHVPEAEVVFANAKADLDAHPQGILLINRVLDGMFDGDSGVDLIRSLREGRDVRNMLLISNFTEAQDESITAGASRGFGKSDLYDESTGDILRAFAT